MEHDQGENVYLIVLLMAVFAVIGIIWGGCSIIESSRKNGFLAGFERARNTPRFPGQRQTRPVVTLEDETTILIDEITVVVTAYSSEKRQTDSKPCEAAKGYNVCKGYARGEKICATANRDIPFGTLIDVPGYGTCTVRDRMNKRFNGSGRIDVYFGKDTRRANAWGNKKLTVRMLGKQKVKYCKKSRSKGYFAWPTDSCEITSDYGMRTNPFDGEYKKHQGVDMPAKGWDSNSYAIADGVVVKSGYTKISGNRVAVRHGNTVSFYAHHKYNLVKVGDKVKKGQALGRIGSTGHSTGPHLHFGIKVNGIWVNPMKYLH